MKRLLLLVFTLSFTIAAFSQPAEKKEHIKQLLEVTGSAKLGIQVINNMIASYKKTYSSVESDFWDEFLKELNPDEMIDLLVPVYDKHFTDEEITQLIAFYNTELGKKVIEKLPLVAQDSYVIGEEWGRKLSQKVISRLKAKGYEL